MRSTPPRDEAPAARPAMKKSQCLFFALDKVHAEGGYINFGMSTHWELQHVGHYDNLAHEFTSFVPPADLEQPWHSALGFHGSVVIGDTAYRKPMPKNIMWRGIMALVIGFWVWRIKRKFDGLMGSSPR